MPCTDCPRQANTSRDRTQSKCLAAYLRPFPGRQGWYVLWLDKIASALEAAVAVRILPI